MQLDMVKNVAEMPKDTSSVDVRPAPVRKAPSGKEEETQDAAGALGGKDPTKATIDSVMSEANQKMKMTKTRCEYSYDEPTKRVSIKVFDEESGEVIREVPPEKSLEMLQKMWELAGIIVDEKR